MECGIKAKDKGSTFSPYCSVIQRGRLRAADWGRGEGSGASTAQPIILNYREEKALLPHLLSPFSLSLSLSLLGELGAGELWPGRALPLVYLHGSDDIKRISAGS